MPEEEGVTKEKEDEDSEQNNEKLEESQLTKMDDSGSPTTPDISNDSLDSSKVERTWSLQPESPPKVLDSSLPRPASMPAIKRVTSQRSDLQVIADVWRVNPAYAITLRGILNIIELVLSLMVMVLLASSCNTTVSSHFVCPVQETFLFVVGCSSVFTVLLIIASCLFSEKTSDALYQSAFEPAYYITYVLLFFCGSIAAVVSSVKYSKATTRMAAGWFGIVACIVYLFSLIWFFMCHRYDERHANRPAKGD